MTSSVDMPVHLLSSTVLCETSTAATVSSRDCVPSYLYFYSILDRFQKWWNSALFNVLDQKTDDERGLSCRSAIVCN